MDEQGAVQTVSLPECPEYGKEFGEALSPNGKYLAYYTGNLYQAPFSLAIRIVSLPDLRILGTIPILSTDFPNNFARLANSLAKNPPPQFKDVSVENIARQLQDAFNHGIQSFAWSPDSEALAFAGQMQGESSDLYTYQMQTGAIARLTSGNEMIQKIDWSPDGKWIGHGSAYQTGEGSEMSMYVVSRDGSRLVSSPRAAGMRSEWFGSLGYLMYSEMNGTGDVQLYTLDVPSGNLHAIWKYRFVGFFSDPGTSSILVSLDPAITDEREMAQFGLQMPLAAGLYRVDYSSGRARKILEGDYFLYPWKAPNFPFVVSAGGKTFAIQKDYSFLPLADGAWKALPSPDSRYLLLYHVIENDPLDWTKDVVSEIIILDENAHPIGTADVSKLKTQCMQWKPDDTALTFQTDKKTVSSLDIPSMKIRTLADNFSTKNLCELRWIGD